MSGIHLYDYMASLQKLVCPELMPAHNRKLTLHDMNIYRNINDDMKFSYIVTL